MSSYFSDESALNIFGYESHIVALDVTPLSLNLKIFFIDKVGTTLVNLHLQLSYQLGLVLALLFSAPSAVCSAVLKYVTNLCLESLKFFPGGGLSRHYFLRGVGEFPNCSIILTVKCVDKTFDTFPYQ